MRICLRTCLTCLALLLIAPVSFGQSSRPADFAGSLDLEHFRLLAVQHEGRLKTFDTLARETIQEIAGTSFLPATDVLAAGPKHVLDPVYVYLDMMLRPEAYRGRRIYFVKKKPVRLALVQAARETTASDILDLSLEDGRFSRDVLTMPAVRSKIEQLDRDVMRTSKDVDALQYAVNAAQPASLKRMMRILPPAGTSNVHDAWFDANGLDTLAANGAGVGMDADAARVLGAAWQKLTAGWKGGDAGAVNSALNRLAIELPLLAPAVYPSHGKLALEHWYYKYHKMTWVWAFYFCAVVLLLMGIVYGWPRAKAGGVVFFAIAFALHTVASGVRWYLAGRIPNSNMFEAVTAAAWFGAAMAIVLEAGPWLAARPVSWWIGAAGTIGGLLAFSIGVPVQGSSFSDWQSWGALPTAGLIVHTVGAVMLIALAVARRRGAGTGLTLLGASVAGMVAMMCGQFLSVELHSDIGTRMPVLNDLWLYIHTNMIIASYALIGVAYVTAAMYVVGRLLQRPSAALWWSMLVPTLAIPMVAIVPGVSMHVILPAWLPFVIVVVCTLACAAGRMIVRMRSPGVVALAGGGNPGMGGEAANATDREAASGMDSSDFLSGFGRVLDGATMLLMELFFVMLWTGIIMGAIWADHSWGRPWGWDPKEVFALNTWIIFLVLVHVRLKVREKALWTAVLVVVGTSVMLFNWIVVNFFITGLHSYA